MPRLMRCLEDQHYYVRTVIGTVPMTYQLTAAGAERLLDRGVRVDDLFEPALLRRLIAEGDAYTGKSGSGAVLDPLDISPRGRRGDPGTPRPSPPEVIDIDGVPHRPQSIVRVHFEASDPMLLDRTVVEFVEQLQSAGAEVIGPVPLPTRVERYCVLSPTRRRSHSIRTHKRRVTVYDPRAGVFEVVRADSLPAGVSVRLRNSREWVEVGREEAERIRARMSGRRSKRG